MSDRPILFSGPMVRALLDGSKTQTRRVMNPQPNTFEFDDNGTKRECHVEPYQVEGRDRLNIVLHTGGGGGVIPDYGLPHKPGDRLWVRETHWAWGHWETTDTLTRTGKPKRRFVRAFDVRVRFEKPADVLSNNRDHVEGWHARLGRFMYRFDSCLTLVVTDVRVQRLQGIRELDAQAEGPPDFYEFDELWHSPASLDHWRSRFANLWGSINGKPRANGADISWTANPWVVSTTFTVHKCNVDKLGEVQ